MYGSYGGYGSMGGMGYGGMGGMGAIGGGMGGIGTYGRPLNPNAPQPKTVEQSQRKKMMIEFFQMMSGLRSVMELGFAGIALANFWTRSIEIFKKIIKFLGDTVKSFANYLLSKVPRGLLSQLVSAEKTPKTMRNVVMMFLRVLALLLIVLGYKMQREAMDKIAKEEAELAEKLQAQQNQEKVRSEIEPHQKEGFF